MTHKPTSITADQLDAALDLAFMLSCYRTGTGQFRPEAVAARAKQNARIQGGNDND